MFVWYKWQSQVLIIAQWMLVNVKSRTQTKRCTQAMIGQRTPKAMAKMLTAAGSGKVGFVMVAVVERYVDTEGKASTQVLR